MKESIGVVNPEPYSLRTKFKKLEYHISRSLDLVVVPIRDNTSICITATLEACVAGMTEPAIVECTLVLSSLSSLNFSVPTGKLNIKNGEQLKDSELLKGNTAYVNGLMLELKKEIMREFENFTRRRPSISYTL